MIRSSSNPDLLAVSVMHFKDSDSDDDAILPTRNSALHSSLRNSGVHDLPNRHPMVRHSQNTVESAANAFENLMTRDVEQQSPSHHSSFSSHFRPFDAFKQKRAKKKEERKVKKSRKLSNSMENMVDDKEVSVGGSNENYIDTGRCTSNSPPSDSPKESRKNSRSGPSIFKRAGRNKSKDQLPTKDSSSKESSLSPPPYPNSPPSLVNGGGGGHFEKPSKSSKSSKRPSMLRSLSASQPVVSGPTLINKQPELSNFDLEGLVKPMDKNWTKCGYLWLRMKLPNNHYAWTHIVSNCWCCCSYCQSKLEFGLFSRLGSAPPWLCFNRCV